jgi:quaternary ammonium compound-resistance protein SugE
VSVSWVALFFAGLFEIGWPLGLKLGGKQGMEIWGPVLAVSCMAISGFLLWYSLKGIPIGTAYAVWTGIGAAGTFVIGVTFFGDANLIVRWMGIAAIVSGVVMLKMGG